ncbi:MAG: flagellar hook-associated protein 3 [Desulfocapsa sp.]|jgi:flagellar hook-associated protein 3 FlgL|nr:flagellar hook-associated protein 3 [Desulfocapsa sp.]MBU3943835.1 flagellar hook-associated protein FlgL [Pseudomonadota bacterium]MCG2743704.1 flagellar hook-associated protein FlgL [Desulfobacteraceae bacterium]MBU3983784.1 flagellar hook-associated protein FlgL [Pseudomonadota bacterium]MBU4083002.1 flagellar hook-associated protein FlgL [Pseudomonadota bacterium]
MKVTNGTTYRMLQTNLGKISTRLEDLRNQGATGIKLNKPSDDPASIRPVLTTRSQIRSTERYLDTMGVSLDKMEATDGNLEHVENILQRVKEITINSINGAMSPADMTVFADEVSQLRQELLDAANATVDGKYIFAGYQENVKPFVENTSYDPALYDQADSATWPYIYQGDPNPTELEITPGEKLQTNLTGNDLFMGISNSVMQAGPIPPAVGYPSDAGRVDIFSVLTRVEEALRAGDIDDPAGAGGGLQLQMENIDTAADQSRRLRSQLGNRASRVDTAMMHQEDVRLDLNQILSRYQDADAIETFAAITKQETAFQAALSITAKVSKISILDYL